MELLPRLLVALLSTVVLLAIAETCRLKRLAPPPARLVMLAIVLQVLVGRGTGTLLGPLAQRWLDLTLVVLLCLTSVRLALWMLLEIPGSLGWWRRPPQLLVQMLQVGLGTLVAVVVARQTLRIDLLGLITTSAVLTAVLGFAAQGLLKDLIAGLELQLGDDFAIGDLVQLGGVQGVVESVSWRDTTLRTVEGARLVVPNGKVIDDVMINKEAYGFCGNRFEIGLDYDIPPAQVRSMLLQLVDDHPLVLSEPKPIVRIKDFGENAILYDLQLWHPKSVQPGILDLRSEVLEQIWYALRRRGWNIPYPVRELRAAPEGPGQDAENRAGDHVVRECLASNRLFRFLSTDERSQLILSSPQIRFGPGETLVREGDDGDSMFILIKGKVAVTKLNDDGIELPVSELGPSDVFGEMTLFLDAPRSTTVRALQECQLLQVHRDSLGRLLTANPRLLEELAEQVEGRLDELRSIDTRSPAKPDLLATMKRLLLNLRG